MILACASGLALRVHDSRSIRSTEVIMIEKRFNRLLPVAICVMLIATSVMGCSGGALTTREKAAGIGALGGAAAGGLIGAAVGHPGAGAAIGGGLGLGAGALIGDHLQGQEQQQYENQRQMQQNQYEIERQRKEAERLRRQQQEY